MPASISPEVRKRRAVVTAWLDDAITLEEAKKRKLTQLTNRTFLHRWEQRFGLYDFAQQARQAGPVLVVLGKGRVALYHRRHVQAAR